MFRTNSFFRFYYCPKLRQKEPCTRPYCQYNHGEETHDNSHANLGRDEYFTNLKSEDVYSSKAAHNSSIVQTTPTSKSSSDSSCLAIEPCESSAITKKTNERCDLFIICPMSAKNSKKTGNSIGNQQHTSSTIKLQTVSAVLTDKCVDNPSPGPQKHYSEEIPSTSGTQKCLTTDVKRTCNEADIDDLGKKIRIAHTPNYAATTSPKKAVTVNKPNYQQKSLERYDKTYSSNRNVHDLDSLVDDKVKPSNTSCPDLNPINTSTDSSYIIEYVVETSSPTKKPAEITAATKCVDNPSPGPQKHSSEEIPSTSGTQKCLTTDVKRTCIEADIDDLGKKIRIAHTPNYAATTSPKKAVTVNKPNYRQKMLERYDKTYSSNRNVHDLDSLVDDKVKPSNTSCPDLNPINTSAASSYIIEYIVETSSPTKKPAEVTAAIKEPEKKLETRKSDNKKAKSLLEKRRPDVKDEVKLPANCHPVPLFVKASKIAINVRTKVLEKILIELFKLKGKFKGRIDLIREAQIIEKDICVNSKGFKSLYGSLATSKVRSLRGIEEKPSPKKDNNKKLDKSKKPSTKHNYSIIKKTPKKTYKDLSIAQLIPILEKLIIPKNLLKDYGFPFLDETTGLAIFPSERIESIYYEENMLVSCDRCSKSYMVPQIPEIGACTFHAGHAYTNRVKGSLERIYSCCRMSPDSVGCQTRNYHVTRGTQFTENRSGFVRTVSRKSPPKIFALDCEMCFTELGFELCRITITNFQGVVVYDKLVKPKTQIIDYNTQYSGLDEDSFSEVTTDLEEVQQYFLKLISAESFVIGHGLDSDFKVLKIIHERVIDTVHLYPHKKGLPFKRALKNLAVNYLNKIIQDNEAGHDSSEDAKTALELVQLKIQEEVSKMLISS